MARFALFLHASDRGTAPERLFDEMMAEAALAEEVGFEACMLAEHHQSPEGHYPRALTLAAAIGARTSRIKVGTSVLLAPLYHPVHLAEECAMVDLVTKGRLILGVGIGYAERDFAPFGVSRKERASRLEELVTFLRRAWTEESVSFAGRHHRFDDVSVVPKPLQRPHPPIWIGGDVRAGLERAGRLGDGWIGVNYQGPEAMAERARVYRASAVRHGRPATVAIRRDGWVAEDRAAAMRDYGPAVASFQRFLREFDSGDAWFKVVRDMDVDDELTGDRLLIGTPDDCIATARKYIETAGVDWFVMRFRHPEGPSHEKVMRAIELFGREVIPKLADVRPPAATSFQGGD